MYDGAEFHWFPPLFPSYLIVFVFLGVVFVYLGVVFGFLFDFLRVVFIFL